VGAAVGAAVGASVGAAFFGEMGHEATACVCAVTALFIIVTAYLFHFIENHRFQIFGEDQGKCRMAIAVW
jgi:hypothetical protein